MCSCNLACVPHSKFYVVSLLYTRLSENSSDELMLPNYHGTDVK